MLNGEIAYLAPLELSSAPLLLEMISDPEVHRWMITGQRPLSLEDEIAFIESSHAASGAGTAYRFEIRALDDGRLLGVCGLEGVDDYHRHAEIGIFIGHAREWGRGFASDAIRTLLSFGFGELGLHSVRIACYPENTRAHRLYVKLGFAETGRDRESHLISGAMRDLVRLDMLEDEYRERYGPR